VILTIALILGVPILLACTSFVVAGRIADEEMSALLREATIDGVAYRFAPGRGAHLCDGCIGERDILLCESLPPCWEPAGIYQVAP
jgi:hypothetical protein